jgi:hypothetical protein
MKERYRAYRRENGVFCSIDTITKQRHNLETSNPLGTPVNLAVACMRMVVNIYIYAMMQGA